MLNDMEKTISLEELAKHAERIARDVETTGTVYRVKRPGRRSMVLVDIEAWKASLEIVEMHPSWQEDMAQARRDVELGRGTPLEALKETRGDAGRPRSRRAPSAPRAATPRPAKRGRRAGTTRRRAA